MFKSVLISIFLLEIYPFAFLFFYNNSITFNSITIIDIACSESGFKEHHFQFHLSNGKQIGLVIQLCHSFIYSKLQKLFLFSHSIQSVEKKTDKQTSTNSTRTILLLSFFV